MQNVWVISGGRAGRGTNFEYYASEDAALVRARGLQAAARQEFEELDARVDLGCTWEQYCEIQDLLPYGVYMVPDVESLNSHNDVIAPSGDVPTGRLWVVLEDGRPEEGRGYATTEEDGLDALWSRNWARWEYSLSEPEMSFSQFRAESNPARYDWAAVDPGPVQA